MVSVYCSKLSLLPNEVHHYALEIGINVEELETHSETETCTERNFYNADYELMNKAISEVCIVSEPRRESIHR